MLYSVVAPSVAEANFWEERRKAVSARPASGETVLARAVPLPAALSSFPDPGGLPLTQSFTHKLSREEARRLPESLKSLPSAYGDIGRVALSKEGSSPLVVLIQDAHGIFDAQKNISSILDHLAPKDADSPRLLVGMEGSVGGYKIARFRSLATRPVREEVHEVLLQNTLINGGEHFGLNAEKEPLLWGLEEESLYLRNVQAYRDAEKISGEAGNHRKILGEVYDSLKRKVLTPELIALDDLLARHNRNEEGDLAAFIESIARGTPLLPESYPHVCRFMGAWKMEKSMDFAQVEQERARALERLAATLSKAQVDDLVAKTLS